MTSASRSDPDTLSPDLYDYAFESDPVPTLERLQREDPAHWSRHGFWYLTRYEDCALVLKDTERFSSSAAGWGEGNPLAKAPTEKAADGAAPSAVEAKMTKGLSQSFNQMDGPEHARIRSLVIKAFSRRTIEERAPRIKAVINDLLDAAAPRETFDLVADFAFHLPIIVASEIIGIPTEDRDSFRVAFERSGALMAPKQSEESWAQGLEAAKWVGRYMRTLIAQRRAEPREDLISALVQAEDEHGALSDTELFSALLTIFTAAGTTTERFVSSGLWLLLSHRDQWDALVADRSLMDQAIAEILRFHHPTQSTSTNRRCLVDVELHGKTMKAGDTIRVGLGAANRDPDVFTDPHRFDIFRKSGQPALSFGAGAHFCIGAALARFEARLAINAIADRWPNLRLVTTDPVRDPRRHDRYLEIMVAPPAV